MIIQEINIKPTLNECFADNGAHSHWELIDSNNGRILWSESQASDKDKEIERGQFWTDAMILEFAVRSHLPGRELTIEEFIKLKSENNL